MELIYIDIITSIYQSILFAYTVKECVVDEKNKVKVIYMVIGFLFMSQFFTGTFGNNLSISVLLPHVLALFWVLVLYKKNIKNAITAYTIIYNILIIFSVIFGNLVFEFVKGLLPIEYINCEKIMLIYIPLWIVMHICFQNMDKIKKLYTLIIYERFHISILIMSFVLDFIVTFYLVSLSEKNQLLKNIMYMLFFILFIVILVYFWKVHQKSAQINKLNKDLEIKNGELRKTKYEYGAKISYLYGLCLMERFDDLKKALKDIINNNNSTPIEVIKNEDSLLSLALKPAIDKGIHVIIEEKCDYKQISMDEMEFYRVVTNIVNNAIKAMNGQGIIIAKTYEYCGNVVIHIENNGPKIEEQQLEKIFESGFTTKNNTDKSHGYGLSIVKDLVESNNGKIHVKSTDAATEFKIVLPIK